MAKKKTRSAPVVIEDDEDEGTELVLDTLDEDDAPDNARDVPMFADIDGRTTRSIAYLRLLKLEPGGPPAYKGMIPLTSTLDSIGQVYGDGTYMIEGLNSKHTVLATKDNIRISLSTVTSGNDRQLALPGVSAESERVERLALRAAEESKQLAGNFTTLVVSTMEQAAERERNFYAASREQMTQMFTSLMTMQQAAFQQTITMMQSSHNQTIQSLDATARIRRSEENDSPQLVDVLLRGLQMGRELSSGGEDDKPAWEQILTSGLGLLSGAKTLEQRAALAPPAAPTPTPSNAPTNPPPSKLSKAARRELREAVHLLRQVRAKGIDPQDLLARLSEVGHVQPDEDLEESADGGEQDSDDSDEGASDFEPVIHGEESAGPSN